MPNIIDSVPSPEFTPVSLSNIYNINGLEFSSEKLGDERLAEKDLSLTGNNVIRGIPFHLGEEDKNNIVFIKDKEVKLELKSPIKCKYLVFIHTAFPKRDNPDEDGITSPSRGRIILGDKAADYQLLYEDGTVESKPIRRRFAIGELRKDWGDECFEAVPLVKPIAVPTISERMSKGEKPDTLFGQSQTRVSADPAGRSVPVGYWVYAMKNDKPELPINGIRFMPNDAGILIVGLTATALEQNPLKWDRRKKVLLSLPDGVDLGQPDESGRYEGLGIDLGQIISVTPRLDYDNDHWWDGYNNKAPIVLENEYVVEYTAHPAARFTVANRDMSSFVIDDYKRIDEDSDMPELKPVEPAEQEVILKVVEAGSKNKVAVKLHIHGEAGEYLPPADLHRMPNPYWFEDYSPEFVAHGIHNCCYIDGETRIKLPLGEVYIEVSKGFEIKPIRAVYKITKETKEITITVEHVLPWREKGWVSADTHVHFLSPQTALLEGAGEGVNIVNLLASQWGELFTNVGDFDGKTTVGSKEAGGDGEYMVRVGTENRQHVLGHISLIGYNGRIITPLTTGGPDESALGDEVEVTLSQWAQQCKDQNGVVILPHFPNPRCEHAASIVLGRIDGVEMTSWGNLYGGIDPYSLSDWYRYLNCGYFVAAVGGTDKMSSTTAVGTVRTYAHIKDGEFTYNAWKEAVRAGKTFATYGPLMEFTVEGQNMGSKMELSSSGGTINAEWKLATVTIPMTKVELVVNGETKEVVELDSEKREASGSFSVKVDKSSWIALRVRGAYSDKHEMIAAHSSPVMVEVEGTEFFAAADAMTILEQIEGALAFIDTVATKAQAEAYKKVRMTLTSAHRSLHNRMHNNGMFHEHTPMDKHEHPDHK
ncbi:hypothetical protein GF312_19690 [Candidatus Poribacteria bacterium]|nr:hypothetical protein [Candidatus Poribacteria bacterium]